MTDKSAKILKQLVVSYQQTGKNRFDSLEIPESCIRELESEGYILRINKVSESIVLTSLALEK